jgi:hypothetical protein
MNPQLIGCVVAVVLWIGAFKLFKRKRETDATGNLALRCWGPCAVSILACAYFLWTTLHNLKDPFHQRYPENTAVEAFFSLFTFLGASWFYYFKIILTADAIQVEYLPLVKKTYPLTTVLRVDQLGGGGFVIRLADGRKVGVPGFISGGPSFLGALSALIGPARV